MLIKEATEELREWFDDWLQANQNYVMGWFSTEEIRPILALRDKIYVGHKFELCFDTKDTQKMCRNLEYGSQFTPKFDFITHANTFLSGIYPKYREYLLMEVMIY